jgi:hypothetical protein
MATLGIELCDAGLRVAAVDNGEPRLITEVGDWPAYAYQDGKRFIFGRAGEDAWFVHPRHVTHAFLSKLTHEPSGFTVGGKSPSFSELAYHFLREFMQSVAKTGSFEKVVIAVPGSYLRDAAVEEEKIGLLLGIANELKLPLAGILDLACAALCDPRTGAFSPTLPVIVVDIHLQGAELSLLSMNDRLERTQFLHLPQYGLAQLLKHLTSAMGNRFLRHTAFDILEDGRIEQTFFRQTKTFLQTGAPEHRYQINTANRSYEMLAKEDQLAGDAQIFVVGLLQAVQLFAQSTAQGSNGCTVALTERAATLPGLESRLRAAGFRRLLRLPSGAAACGAARIGAARLQVPEDLADVAVETSVPSADARRAASQPWSVRLNRVRFADPRPPPTHAILEGVGHMLNGAPQFVIGASSAPVDLCLPEAFNSANDCLIPLQREDGQLWFVDPATQAGAGDGAARVEIHAGDTLTVRCGGASTEILFAHCQPAPAASS